MSGISTLRQVISSIPLVERFLEASQRRNEAGREELKSTLQPNVQPQGVATTPDDAEVRDRHVALSDEKAGDGRGRDGKRRARKGDGSDVDPEDEDGKDDHRLDVVA